MTSPSGFFATCRCGAVVAAMDYERMDRKEAGAMLGKWLMDGFTVTPKFGGSWSVQVTGCECPTPTRAPTGGSE